MKQIIKFGIVGSLGFCTDALVLLLLVEKFMFSIELSRIVSFLVAVFITWFLNRNLTFNQNNKYSKHKEYSLYLFIQTLGALLNYIIFILLVKNFIFFEKNLIFSLAIASLLAMFFNFYFLKKRIYN